MIGIKKWLHKFDVTTGTWLARKLGINVGVGGGTIRIRSGVVGRLKVLGEDGKYHYADEQNTEEETS